MMENKTGIYIRPLSPMPAIARETWTPELLAELRPLIAANYTATGNTSALNPQWESFAALEQAGALCVIVARVEGRAVGYVAHAALVNHMTGETEARCIAVYLDPAHRMLTRRLVTESEQAATQAGARSITFGVPHLSRAGAFFEVMGYECMELVMGKRLDLCID